eukprot:PhM_4_TR13946/c0_g2_i1/m.5256/K14802/DRS2, ATP8A; phospholipid-transporting ATPase
MLTSSNPPAPVGRSIAINNSDVNKKAFRVGNYIVTSKYNIFTFLPLNLLEQFTRVSNIYFLLNVIICLIPGVSPIVPATAAMPLIFVLLVAAVKDGFEDYQRHVQDDVANSMPTVVIRQGVRTQVRSQDVVVGDILLLENDKEVPADAVLLGTGLSESLAYIDTAMLDGETNLKSRRAARAFVAMPQLTESGVGAVSGSFTVQEPDPKLSMWQGVANLTGAVVPLNIEQFLYRGAVVRNTPWTLAIVVYVGKETKMFLNLKKKAPKSSILDRKLNKLIASIFLFKEIVGLMLCAGTVWFEEHSSSRGAWYLDSEGVNGIGLFFWRYLTYFVLFSNMIPISLFVTLEVCKAAQALWMLWDVHMFHVTPDGREQSCKPRTSNLNEQLSVVKYVFSDKTGTLTTNTMVYVGGTSAKYANVRGNECVVGAPVAGDVLDYFLHLAVCNTALPFPCEDEARPRRYESVSPDEVALCDAATRCGVVLSERSMHKMVVDVRGTQRVFRILATLEFNADRKMMTIVLEDEATGVITQYTKGADTSVAPNCVDRTDDIDVELSRFAQNGLRTLVLGQRVLSREDLAAWQTTYDKAQCEMDNREAAINAACLCLEKDMMFGGITAIEDALQDSVPETINMMLDAAIVVWMLTGDKRETAVNVGVSCGLVRPQIDTLVQLHVDGVSEMLAEGTALCKSGKTVCAVLDGMTFDIIEHNYHDLFMEFGLRVRSAVCCRLTPGQKATIVRFFQQHGESTLAIGDGANDVSMIQESYVGIGIMGLEGSQAELTSDYAIPRFKHLQRLLFVHGRYSLYRNSMCVAYSLYKNVCLCVSQVLYTMYSGYSGTTVFDSWLLAVFNMVFCSLPPLCLGIFERDIPEAVAARFPTLYAPLRLGEFGNLFTVFAWGLEAILQGLTLFFMIYPTMLIDDVDPDGGRTSGLALTGTLLMTTIIFTLNTRAILTFREWTVIPLFAIFASYLLYFFTVFVYSAIPLVTESSSFYNMGAMVWSRVKLPMYLLLFAVGWSSIVPFAFIFCQRRFRSTTADVLSRWYIERSHNLQIGRGGGAFSPMKHKSRASS